LSITTIAQKGRAKEWTFHVQMHANAHAENNLVFGVILKYGNTYEKEKPWHNQLKKNYLKK
jgi:hypothetical protein